MKTIRLHGMVLGGLLLLPVAAYGADGESTLDLMNQTRWSWDLTAGFDSYLHSYYLATSDTNEAVAEFMTQAGIEGQSAWSSRHRWRVRAEGSIGTELYRERVDAFYSYLDQDRFTRLRLSGRFWGRQFQPTTEYSRSSNNWEGRLEARGDPVAGRKAALDLRAWAGFIDYETPSTLEADFQEQGVGMYVRSGKDNPGLWLLGGRHYSRDYPDSSEINRTGWAAEGSFDKMDSRGQVLRVYHKSDRRIIADELVKPSAWTHWTDIGTLIAAGSGFVYLDLQSENWNYDWQNEVYFNSWRVEGSLGYRGGDYLSVTWLAGLAGEWMDSENSVESYSQAGIRGGIESFGMNTSGSLTLEFGRRRYHDVSVDLDPSEIVTEQIESFVLYTDFNYWKIWLNGTWYITQGLDLGLMVNYQPESHTEKEDNSTIGFASLRLVWRP